MKTWRKRIGADKMAGCRLLAVLSLLILCMAVSVVLSSCGHGKESQSGSQDEHSTHQDSDTDNRAYGDQNPGKGLENGSKPDSDSSLSTSQKDRDSSSSDDPQASPADKTVIKEIYNVGDSLLDGDLKITYVASGDYIEESEYQQPEAGHKYIFLEYAFENTGDKNECPVSQFAFRCFADGFAAPAYFGGVKELPASLSAGRCAVGNLYFSVPEDAGKIEVEYQPDKLDAAKVRFSYEGEKDSGYKPQIDTGRTAGAFQPGDTAASDLQRILYLSCEADDRDNENVHPAKGCTYWTLTFEFENLQDEDRQISVHDFSCYADGRSCSRTLFRDDYLSADIPGGRKAKGTVTFEVPDDATTVEVEYDTGRRSDAPVVFTVR